MPNRIATFEKVSYEEFKKSYGKSLIDFVNSLGLSDTTEFDEKIDELCRRKYDNIKLPKRATTGSAGYDFYSPAEYIIQPNSSIVIPTGIRCKIDNDYLLSIYPRSGLGFKHRLGLDNTVGIIDSDYYYSDNEGHIMIKIHHELNTPLKIESGKAFAQGIFTQYGITTDDDVTETRNGGFGSTDSK